MSKETSIQVVFILGIVMGIVYILLSLLLILDPVKMEHDPGGLTSIFTAIFRFVGMFLFICGVLTLGASYSLFQLKKTAFWNFITSHIFTFPLFLFLIFLSSENSVLIFVFLVYFLYVSISSLLLLYGREELTEE